MGPRRELPRHVERRTERARHTIAILASMQAGNVARVVFVVAACVAAVGSATSGSNNASQQQYGYSPPPPSQMESTRALGLWRSTFGPVKIESDESRGGIQAGAVQGVWTYQRRGQDVIGYFYGSLRGNVLQF